MTAIWFLSLLSEAQTKQRALSLQLKLLVLEKNKITHHPNRDPVRDTFSKQNISLSIFTLYYALLVVFPMTPCSLAFLFTSAHWLKFLLPHLCLADFYSYFGSCLKSHFLQRNPCNVLDMCFRVLST